MLITQSHQWNCVHREKPLSCLNGTWEGYLIFQCQTKVPNPTTNEQEQGDALIQGSQAQLGTQALRRSSWPDKNMAPALWLFSSPTSAGTAPSHFFTAYSPQRFLSAVIWGIQILSVQEWSLTIHLRCERTDAPWTCPRHEEQNKSLQGEPSKALQHLCNCLATCWTPSIQMAAAASRLPLGQQLWSNQHCLRFTPELILK